VLSVFSKLRTTPSPYRFLECVKFQLPLNEARAMHAFEKKYSLVAVDPFFIVMTGPPSIGPLFKVINIKKRHVSLSLLTPFAI
jgi:hypothetical protein